MSQLNILVLTDTAKHSAQNSLYAIVGEMVRHPQIGQVMIADRNEPLNQNYFYQENFKTLYGIILDERFDYDSCPSLLSNETKFLDTSKTDMVFMRLPRPLTDHFLTGLKQHYNVPFVNDPMGMIATSSKEFLLNFPTACPPMRLCKSRDDILTFSRDYDIVIKPLKDYGGRGVVKLSNGKVDLGGGKEISTEDYFESIHAQLHAEGYLAMKYLKNVSNGDKRLLVVDGEILASSLRLPAADSWLCNVAQGGRSVMSEPTAVEVSMVKSINPLLRDRGIFMYGVDTLEDDSGQRVISEINTMSIGGWPQSQTQTGKPIINMMLNKMIQHVRTYN